MSTPQKTNRKARNLTLSGSAWRFGQKLKKPLRQNSVSGVVETVIFNEAERLGLKKPDANGVQKAA